MSAKSAPSVPLPDLAGVISGRARQGRQVPRVPPMEAPYLMDEPRWVPLAAAALQLGLSIDSVRRRLRKGELVGRQVATPQGFTWEIQQLTGGG